MGRVELVHDVLDAQLCSHGGEKIGRVDALVLELRDGRPPRVAAMLLGGPVRAARSGRPMTWLARALRALGRVRHEGVSRIDFATMRRIGDTITLDVEQRELESEWMEHWLAEHVVDHVPGADTGEERK